MPQPIRVNPQELADAAERVRGYADQLRAGHGSAITAADAAQSGLVGQSAQAISAKTQRWQATTAALERVLASQADRAGERLERLRRDRGRQPRGPSPRWTRQACRTGVTLTVEDVLRWDPGAVRTVRRRGAHARAVSIDTADSLPTFPDWTGAGADEARQAIEHTRQALLKDADAALAAARAADAAATNVQIVKDNLQQVLDAARDLGLGRRPATGTVQPTPRVQLRGGHP